jgi:CMP-N-acetylneuraminic acid synthetase
VKELTALLPMKAHSERVPNKNIRPCAGRPLYHWVAEVLQSSEFIQQILIDTDSEMIATEAVRHFSKVRIIARPVALQGDFVSMNAIIAYDIQQAAGEHFLQTHSTNPLLTRETLEHAIEDYFESLAAHDSLFTVTRIQSRLYWPTGDPVNHNPSELARTQDLSPVFEENSNLYLFSKASFAAAGNRRIGLRPKMFTMKKIEAIDIDEAEDWQLAETLLRVRQRQ